MNSFEADIKRAIISKGFIIGIILEILVLKYGGYGSTMFRVSIPIVCTFPYTTAWLLDYQSGFIKSYLYKTTVFSYIFGKITSCSISGGAVLVVAIYFYSTFIEKINVEIDYLVIFSNGALWATTAATLAVIANSKYVAYGGSFVICYMLVILNERYFSDFILIYPYEWLFPGQEWVLGSNGVVVLLGLMILLIMCIYGEVVRGYMKRV